MSALTISPEDEKRVKGMGFLNNRGTDLFSARVLTTNGKVTAAQHRCMADAAEKFGNGNLTFTWNARMTRHTKTLTSSTQTPALLPASWMQTDSRSLTARKSTPAYTAGHPSTCMHSTQMGTKALPAA